MSLFASLLWLHAGMAAPQPLPALTAEETQLRTLVEPLREALTEGVALQPLHAWLDAREAAGQGRAGERELRRTLKRITEDQHKDLRRAAEWVRTLQIQRSKLYAELADGQTSLRRALKQSQDFAPVPLHEELLPGRADISDAFLTGDVGGSPSTASALDDAGETLPEPDDAESTDVDAPRLLDRLTLDLTALRHLLHECDNEYEREKARHRAALDGLTQILQARREAVRRPGKAD